MSWHLKNWAKLYKGTKAEHALEEAVASLGRPYRWQHPLWGLGLFPDFVLLADRLVIEVDDPGHYSREGIEKDKARTAKLEQAGWRVVRCTNEEAVRDPWGTVDALMVNAGLPYRTRAPSPVQPELPLSHSGPSEPAVPESRSRSPRSPRRPRAR